MMLNINIVPDITAPGGGLGMPSMRHASAATAPNYVGPAMAPGRAMPGMADR